MLRYARHRGSPTQRILRPRFWAERAEIRPVSVLGVRRVRRRLRNRSLPRIAQGFRGCLSEGRLLRRHPRRRRCPEAAPGPLPRQLRSMSGQRMLQRIHAAGELYLARGGRLSCSGRVGQAPALTWPTFMKAETGGTTSWGRPRSSNPSSAPATTISCGLRSCPGRRQAQHVGLPAWLARAGHIDRNRERAEPGPG